MTIDQRLERLTDRHEALTMTVELMSREGGRVSRNIEKLLEVTRHDGEHILALAWIAEAHENRLERIEGVQ